MSYAEYVISNQDPLSKEKVFPLDAKAPLTEADYLEYFKRLEMLASEQGIGFESLILNPANNLALKALKNYLTQKISAPPFKELILESTPEEDTELIPNFLKEAASKGLQRIKLQNTKISKKPLAELSLALTTESLALEVELPQEYFETQKSLDIAASKNQRKQRIDNFGALQSKLSEAKADESMPKRTRNLGMIGKNKVSIDTEADADSEVQVEVAIETPVEEEAKLQAFEDKTSSELVNRENFLKFLESSKFKEEFLTPKAAFDTWDCWLGNISHLVVKPNDHRINTNIEIHDKPEDVNINVHFKPYEPITFTFCLIQPDKSQKPTGLFYKISQTITHPTEHTVTLYNEFYGDPLSQDSGLDTFLKTCYPAVQDNNFAAKDLTDEQFLQLSKYAYSYNSYYHPLYIQDYYEHDKGEYIIDASSLEKEEAESLENLVKICPIKFKDPMVGRKVYQNKSLPHMTKAAFEKLLEHRRQLRFGLDFEHLPGGFEIKDVSLPEGTVSVLYYSAAKARLQKEDPYALKFIEPETPPALSFEMIDLWLDLSTQNPTEIALKKLYQTIANPYDRNKVKAFRTYLPILLKLPLEAITNFDASLLAAKNLSEKPKKQKVKLEEQLLYRLLDAQNDIQSLDLVKSLLQSFKLSIADMNGLLAVYSEYGFKGLEELAIVWGKCLEENKSPSLFESLKNFYFPHFQNFLPCLNPNFEIAISIIKNFSSEERQLWDSFFSMHCKAVGYDDLYNLAKAFQDFKEKIHEKNLDFKALRPFKNIKSLPVALSRILAILDASAPENLTAVWEGMAAIDLQSNAAIKLITDAGIKPKNGVLIIPEMQIEPRSYAEKNDAEYGGTPDHGYHALYIKPEGKKKKDIDFDIESFLGKYNLTGFFIHCKDEKELEKNFYRYIAVQPYAKSVDFYRKVAALINASFSDFKTRAIYFALIAQSTSILEASLSEKTEAELLSDAQSLFNHHNNFSLPSVLGPLAYPIMLQKLEDILQTLQPTPTLDWLNKIYSILEKLMTFNILEVSKAIKKLEAFTDIFKLCSQASENKYAFFEGLRFVDFKNLSHQDFTSLVSVAESIILYKTKVSNDVDVYQINYGHEYIYYQKHKLSESLLSLISTFNLQKDILELFDKSPWAQLIEDNDENFIKLVSDSLNLLTKIKTNPHLKQQELIEFITVLHESYLKDPYIDIQKTSLSLVQKNFGKYFEKDFFTQLLTTAATLPENIVSLVQKSFTTVQERDLVTKLIASFNQVDDFFHREAVIKCLAKITANLSNFEKNLFLKNLSLINDNRASKLQDLYKVLIIIGEPPSSPSELLFIMDYYAKEAEHNVNQMLSYCKEAIPLLYLHKSKYLKIADLQPLAADLLLYTDNFVPKFVGIVKELELLSQNFPNLKEPILTIVSAFINLAKKDPAFDVLKFVKYLSAANLDANGELLQSLCDNYLARPKDLYQILESLQSQPKQNQALVLELISSLENNGSKTEVTDIQKFITYLQAAPELFKEVKAFFKSPPYPDFKKLNTWHEETIKPDQNYQEKIQTEYQNYELNFCPRETDNGFDLNKAQDYNKEFKGIGFTDAELEALSTATNAVKSKSVEDLQVALAKLKALPSDELAKEHPKLLALLAELMYRAKGSPGGHGSSFELNTVQYMAILAYLKSGGHVTAQMATGEGKSRTLAVALACQFAMSKTVDFITSDMQLAQRDFLEYQSFYKIIGAKTNLIHANSSFSNYQEGGINFSDASNLSLFRNKARSLGLADMVIAKDSAKRALILDEADRTYFDIADTRFNLSETSRDINLKNMEWIYPLLVKFFNQKDKDLSSNIYKLYEKDMDGCNAAFKDFIKGQKGYKEDMLIQIKALPKGQLEAWQDAAVAAINLKLGADYTIEPNVLVATPKGPKLASEARLIYGSRISRTSKFSFGVHQCLHAFLNEELKNPNSPTYVKGKDLLEQQGKGHFSALPFHIHSEKQIIYSSTSKSLLDDYQEGELWAITGTAGSLRERQEASILYSKKGRDASLMKFISIPRREKLNREDKPLRVTKNFSKRAEAILKYIIEAQEAGRPSLVVCETDKEALELSNALKALAKLKGNIPGHSWLFVDSATTASEEKNIISKAGNPGMVTIATTRIGRGTDIKLADKSKEKGGLRVIASFLPRERDLYQIFGRAGRYKDLGDARIVVDRAQLKNFFGTKNFKKLFLSTEFYTKYQQSLADRDAQIERLLKQSLSDFRVKITDAFFSFYNNLPPGNEEASKRMLDSWSRCTTEIDQLWAQTWPDIQDLLKNPKIDIEAVNARLKLFKEKSEQPWKVLQKDLGENTNLKNLDALVLSSQTEDLLKFVIPKRLYAADDRVQVYKAYDSALDGRAVIYDELFMDFKSIVAGDRLLFANIRSWWNDSGILFADSRAILSGHRPLFANLRAWIAKDPKAKQELQLNCKTIEDALKNSDQASLKELIKEQRVNEIIGPESLNLGYQFKSDLVEAILSYAHKIYQKNSKLSNKDLEAMQDLLEIIKTTDNKQLVDALNEKLIKLKGSFISSSLKNEMKQVIKDNQFKLK